MHLTPTERDRLLLFLAAELARARRGRGLRLNAPEATALIADVVTEAARDGARQAEAVAVGQRVLSRAEVLPGVPEIVGSVNVEATFDDGTRSGDTVRSRADSGKTLRQITTAWTGEWSAPGAPTSLKMPYQDILVGDFLGAVERHKVEPLMKSEAGQSVGYFTELTTVADVIEGLADEIRAASSPTASTAARP